MVSSCTIQNSLQYLGVVFVEKSYTDLFMRDITTGYCIKAHVELSTEMQNLKGGKGKYLFFIKRILCEDGKTTHITRTKRIIRQYDSFITCCIFVGIQMSRMGQMFEEVKF